MAQFFTDFRDETIGVSPSSIATVFGSMTSDIVSGNALLDSDRSLELTHGAGGFAREAVSWLSSSLNSDSQTTVQIFAEFVINSGGLSISIPGPLLNGSGDQSTRTGYVQWYRDSHTLRKYDNGSGSSLGTESLTVASGTIQRRLEIKRDGSLIEVRHWADGDPRPSTANISVTDGSPLTASGFVGISNLARSSGEIVKVFSIAAGTNGDPAPTAPVPSGDNLNADDIQSTSEVTAATLGQTHALTANDVESASQVSVPTLAEQNNEDNLSANDVQSVSEVTQPAIGQLHNLAANDAESSSEVTPATIGQEHALTSVDISSLSQVSQPTLASNANTDALSANDIESSSEVTAATIGQAHALTPDDVESASQTQAVTIAQIHALTATDAESATQVSSPVIRNPDQSLVQPIKNTKATASQVAYRATVSQTTYKAAIIQKDYKAEAG